MRVPESCPLPSGATVWGYLRDSGGDRQDRSVAQQREVLEAYCVRHGLVLEHTYADEAKPGSSAETRDALQAMLAAVRDRFPPVHDARRRQQQANRIRHGVVFWTFARLGRDDVETRHLLSDLELRGLATVSLADPLVTGNAAIDPIARELMAFKAKMDLEQLSRESRRGLHHTVALRDTDPGFLAHNPGHEPTGAYLGIFPGTPPTGYTTERIVIGRRRDGTLHEVQRLVPDPTAWDRARLAWQMRVEEQAPYREIYEATRLLKSVQAYHYFFQKRIYAGELEFGGEVYGDAARADFFVRPLVPLEWYETEASRREKRAFSRQPGGTRQAGIEDPRRVTNGRLLSGLAVCARCGAPLWTDKYYPGVISTTGQKRQAWPFYWCRSAKRRQGCDAGRINARRLERIVVDHVRATVLSPDRLRAHLDELLTHLDERRARLGAQLETLQRDLDRTRQQTENLVDVLAERPASPALLERLDTLEAAQGDLRQRIAAAEAELAAVNGSVAISDAQLAEVSARALADVESRDLRQARRALSAYVKRVEVDPGRPIRATIVYSVPYPAPGETAGPGSLRLEIGEGRVDVNRHGPLTASQKEEDSL